MPSSVRNISEDLWLNLKILPAVRAALDQNIPVVALESTIIAHGMPYPQNLRCAADLENAVRRNGAVPATVAVIHGIPCVGLDGDQLRLLATNPKVRKLARRDLPSAFASRAHGATTVSATMFLSSAAGIPVFATGGIGGVHRGAESSFDISSDVMALATIPQLVVCAGAKSILDLPKTLEALETASVPVFVLNSPTFPAFYTRDSGLPAPQQAKSEYEMATVVEAARQTNAANGILLAVPVPEAAEADALSIQKATEQALTEMKTRQLLPNEVTPFLLKRIAELTKGASLKTNMVLAENNAEVAARVAVYLSQMSSSKQRHQVHNGKHSTSLLAQRFVSQRGKEKIEARPPQVVVIGGIALDIHCQVQKQLIMGSSNGGEIRQYAGGVAKNVAEAASVLCRARVKLVSCIGDDVAGDAVLSMLQGTGLDTDGIIRYEGRRTGVCCVVHDSNGDLKVGVADFDDLFREEESFMRDAEEIVKKALSNCTMGVSCWFEPTTTIKCTRVVEAGVLDRVTYMSPNESELRAIASAQRKQTGEGEICKGMSCDESVLECAKVVLSKGKGLTIVCTRGARGVTKYFRSKNGKVENKDYAAVYVAHDDIRNTTGAGDCFAGRCLGGLAMGESEDEAIENGILAATRSCMSDDIVPRDVAKGKL